MELGSWGAPLRSHCCGPPPHTKLTFLAGQRASLGLCRPLGFWALELGPKEAAPMDGRVGQLWPSHKLRKALLPHSLIWTIDVFSILCKCCTLFQDCCPKSPPPQLPFLNLLRLAAPPPPPPMAEVPGGSFPDSLFV